MARNNREQIVLVVEDEEDIQQLVCYNLLKQGFRVLSAGSVEEAQSFLAGEKIDLVLLDLMLPGTDGLTFCRRLREDPAFASLPIIMLTARGEEADIVNGFVAGADDYLTKPFSPAVLLARVRAVLRRRNTPAAPPNVVLSIGCLSIDPPRRLVTVNGHPIALTASEFDILAFLAAKPGWVFSRQQIIDAIRGDDYAVTDRLIDVQVFGLRKKLLHAADLLETVRGVGYRLKEPDE